MAIASYSNSFEANRWMAKGLANAIKVTAHQLDLNLVIEDLGGLLFKSFSFSVRGDQQKIVIFKKWLFATIKENL